MVKSVQTLLPCALTAMAYATIPTLASAADSNTAATSNPAAVQELQQVIVIGNAPLPGFGLPLNQIPSNVQTANASDMQREQTTDVADYINNNFSGVNVSEGAGNPFQLDIYYHGFTASPLLGTPEGLSVYLDGVRVNESFGDTVNWDLIPESAISTVSLISGSIRSAARSRCRPRAATRTLAPSSKPTAAPLADTPSRVRPAASSARSITSLPAISSMRPAGAMCLRRASGKASARLAGRPTARIST
jgi:hypothetical protein